MTQKFISASLIFIWLSTLVLQPLTARAASPTTWYDTDGDGIPDHMELNGWYSGEKGVVFGPYVTNVNNPDSDGDGLTDGEEQLFATNPNDKTSPGLYVQYENRFQTARYFSDTQFNDDESGYLRWLKAGHFTLMSSAELFAGKGDGNGTTGYFYPTTIPRLPNLKYSDSNNNEETDDVGMVVRRGTTFVVGGDTSGTLAVTGPQTIVPVVSQCSSGWEITIPTNAKLGTYNATWSKSGSLSRVMPIRVIFELPATDPLPANKKAFTFADGKVGLLSDDDVKSFAYIEKPTTAQKSPTGLVSRDETAVWWMTRQSWYGYDCVDPVSGGVAPCASGGQAYHRTDGYAQGAVTDQYRKYVFRDLVMPAIQGQSSYNGAINALAAQTDREISINYNQVHSSISRILNLSPQSGGTFKSDMGACQDASQLLTSFSRSAGLVARPFIVDWNTKRFQGNTWKQNGINYYASGAHGESTSSGWYDHTVMLWDPTLNSGSGAWVLARGYAGEENDTAYPFDHSYSSYNTNFADWYPDTVGDIVVTANSAWDYWDHRSNYPSAINKFGEGMVNPPEYWWDVDTFNIYANDDFGDMEFYAGTSPSYNFYTNGYSNDYQWDSRYPQSLRRVHPAVDTFSVSMWSGNSWVPSDWVRSAAKNVYGLPAGRYDAIQNWMGEPIGRQCPPYYDGTCPFNLFDEGQRVARENEAEPKAVYDDLPLLSSDGRSLIPLEGSVPTQSGQRGNARIAGQPRAYPQDTDNDGYLDALVVDINLNIAAQGHEFMARASLYGANRQFINSASWMGQSSPIRLVFPQADGKAGPYTLENLTIQEVGVGQLNEPTYFSLGNVPELVNASPVSFVQPGRSPREASFSGAVMGTVSTPDTDGDGLFDKLIIPVQVNVTDGNSYRVEAWLVDSKGDLVTISEDAPLAPGAGTQFLNLTFDGRAISGHGVDGPFTVEALRVLQGTTGYNVRAEIEETGWSLNYTANQFGPKMLLRNNFETSGWVTQLWSLVTNQSVSPSTSGYTTNPAADNYLRWQNSIDASNYAKLGLRFNSCYKLGSVNDKAQPQALQGATWTTLNTYSNSTQPWNEKFIELDSSFDELSTLKLQFLGVNGGNLKWNVDDVRLFGWPAIKNPSVSYVSGTVGSSPVTFNASFDSVASNLPVTYTWNFNDGTPTQIQVTNSTLTNTTMVHSFPSVSFYPFTLTIQTPYDKVDFPALAGPGVAVNSASFTVNPTVPTVGAAANFAATYGPADATNASIAQIKYTWDFGDGTIVGPSTSAATPAHTYQAGGSYQVKLTVSNGFGTEQFIQTVEVKQAVSAVTNVTVDPTSPTELSGATFTALITPTTASAPITYLWHFGNGDTASTTMPSVVYTYPVKGNYNVSVSASNPYGPPTLPVAIPVTVLGKPVTATSFVFGANSALGPYAAVLTATYLPNNAATPVTLEWYVNGSSVGTGNTLSYNFGAPDAYTVRLVASNGYGTPVSYTEVITTPFDDDYDGLSNDEEVALGTDPKIADTDGDTLLDGQEVHGLLFSTVISRSNGFGGTTGHPDTGSLIKTNPLLMDTDNDGLEDGKEVALGSNPQDEDTDNDGLLDGEESGSYTTSAFDWDTDHEGLSDYLEKQVGTSGFNPDSESDGPSLLMPDGINDLIEVGPDPAHPLDADADGVIDALEIDSDGDGVLDKNEYVTVSGFGAGSDPLCLNSTFKDNPNATVVNCLNNDVDGDGLLNYRDPDADGDGVNDGIEGATTDSNGDGVYDFLQTGPVNAPLPVVSLSLNYTPFVPGDSDMVTFNVVVNPVSAVMPITYTWNFGDGKPTLQTNAPTAQHAFSPTGKYTVTVSAANELNTTTTPSTTVVVTVGGTPVSGVVLTAPTYVFVDQVIDITAILSPTASPTVAYTWTVDSQPPFTSTSATVPYSFTAGSHFVSVEASNKYPVPTGSKAIAGLVINAGYPITQVSVSYTPTMIVEDSSVTFTAKITQPNASSPITYVWQVGSNWFTQTDTLNFSYVFTKQGVYNVVLTATNNYSAATYSKTVVVGRPVQGITITMVPTSPVQADVITFTVSVTPTDLMTVTPPITYVWQFGDEAPITTTGIMMTRVYSDINAYSVTVKALNEFGFVQSLKLFTVTGKPVSQVWVEADATMIMDGDRAFFTATYAPNNAALPVKYTWNFNDGTPLIVSEDANLIHEFTGVGTYTVWLTATNGWGQPAVTQTTMVVQGRPIRDLSLDVKPDFLFDKNTATLSVFVRPYNASQPVVYQWEFGDGTSLITTSSTIYHPYNYGTYVLTVTATSEFTTPKVVTGKIVVEGTSVSKVTLESGLGDLQNGLKVAFTATVEPAGVSVPVTYLWNFGDNSGLLSTPENRVNHTYATSGTYTVWVTATNQFNTNSPSASQELKVPFDTDNDGLSDVQELALGTDLNKADTDGDGASDGVEVTYKLNPKVADSDGDGILDGVEVGSGSQPADTDKDGIIDALDTDADNDTFLDSVELDVDTDHDGKPDYQDLDSDNDLLPDKQELTYQTSRTNPDTDGDGVSDGQEVNATTNPLKVDSDNDTLSDTLEIGQDYVNPKDTDKDGKIDALDADSDEAKDDGVPDVDEYTSDGTALSAACTDTTTDSDKDGLVDCQDNDADGDGVWNYLDSDNDNDTIPDRVEYPGQAASGRLARAATMPGCTNTTVDRNNNGTPDCQEVDVDGDGLPNHLDVDANGNNILDKEEVGANPSQPVDSNQDGLPDYLDTNPKPQQPKTFLPIILRK